MKTITNNDVLTIEIKSKEYMNMEISSEAKKSHTKFELKLLDINESRIEVPEIEMTTITTLPSTDFQRLCRDMSNICLLYTSPSPRDRTRSRMPSSA